MGTALQKPVMQSYITLPPVDIILISSLIALYKHRHRLLGRIFYVMGYGLFYIAVSDMQRFKVRISHVMYGTVAPTKRTA